MSESTIIRDSYENAVCPDCGLMIPLNVVDGESCNDCGHVFYLPTESDD